MDKKLQKKMKDEFLYLKQAYPLTYLSVDFHCGDALIYSENGNEKFVCDKLEEGKAEFTICIYYNNQYELTKTDLYIMKKHNVVKEHLPFWYLYHEYGHLIDVNEMIKEQRVEEVRKLLIAMEETVNDIKNQENKDVLYKEIPIEKNADLIANSLYMNRVKELIVFFKQ